MKIKNFVKMGFLVAIFFVFSLFEGNFCFAAEYYISSSGSDVNNGTIEHPWLSIGHALNKFRNGGGMSRVEAGDGGQHTVFLRDGVHMISEMNYNSGGPYIVTNSGENAVPIVIKSFPGEWAILDATGMNQAIHITYKVYNIIFENFEIRNANAWGINAKADGAWESTRISNCIFRNLYIHHNNKNNDVNSNPAGILLSAENTIVENCTFIENGAGESVTHHNSANLILMGNYQNTYGELAPYPRKNNIIRYNIFEGSTTAIKDKGPNSLVDSATNCSGSKEIINRHPEWYSDIHHNIFKAQRGAAYYGVSDYMKFHHNLLIGGNSGVHTTDELRACQTIYKVQVYNNTFIEQSNSSVAFPSSPTVMGYDHDVYNNLFIGNNSHPVVFVSGQSNIWPSTFDNNGYASTFSTVVRFRNFGNLTFEQWQQYGNDIHSNYKTYEIETNYTLPIGSPAIGAGRDGIDLGAFPVGIESWESNAGYKKNCSAPSSVQSFINEN